MARTPDQGLYLCFECHGNDDDCWRCNGAGYLLWENLTKEEQDDIQTAWDHESATD